MKKTAQQYVYDAVDYIRKQGHGLPQEPTKDEDSLSETYGLEEKDVCKLIDAISNDCEINLKHKPFHALNTVGEFVNGLQEAFNETERNKEKTELIESSVTILRTVSEGVDGIASILKLQSLRRALFILIGADLTDIEEGDKLIKDYIIITRKLSDRVDMESLMSAKVKSTEIIKKMEEQREFYNNLMKDAGTEGR